MGYEVVPPRFHGGGIRRALEADAEALAKIAGGDERSWRAEIDGTGVWLAEEDEELVGYVQTYSEGDVGHIVELAVAYYGRGIARLLVKEAVRGLRRAGCKTVEVRWGLASPEDYDDDGKFWPQLRFDRVMELEPGERGKEAIYLFRRTLDGQQDGQSSPKPA